MSFCGQSEKRTTNSDPKGTGKAAPASEGKAVFEKNCKLCHGADGRLGLNGAKDLTASLLTLEERIQMIAKGKNLMTPFEKILSPQEIEAVALYTLTLRNPGK